MKNALASFSVGFIFSIGLGLSGMTQPQKVIGFLDIFGKWDPSLLFVMIGAIAFHFITYKIIRKRQSPLLSAHWHVPTKKQITPSLVMGSLIFGAGWALAGLCPGPAITLLSSKDKNIILFVVSMLLGMSLFKLVDKKLNLQK